ncbi:NAD(P)-binding protein [Bowmanella sp. Y26]|uniref:NAD(P)/FAD-dependent oxidoreductase n=1 Tax=Bowmanella yangjiangensis TaxID=2811230 RepID=UPI001BDD80CC|nr:FAD-dependent oxidoreductase [Bowmanella yangjiangensis]MBT1063088.1 NAD(P)-binding protein [Bowmanella yangjiangensis]
MDIAVVGAGVTGSLIAASLQKQGHKVSVFEKSRGRGGRTTCKRTHWGQFDLGAPFIRPTQLPVLNIISELESLGIARRWMVTPYHRGETFVSEKESAPIYVMVPGMNAACHHWLTGCRLATSVQITHLQKTPKGWILWDSTQCKFGLFDWVIVTAPWPQTYSLLAPYVLLAPLEERHWQPCWAVAVQLQSALPDAMPIVYSSDSLLQLAVLDSAKPQRQSQLQTWVMYLTHQASASLSDESSEAVSFKALTALAQMFERDAVDTLQCYAHFWRYARLASEAPRIAPVFDSELGLAAVGDWTVGGSVEASIKAATQFCQQFGENFCYAQVK